MEVAKKFGPGISAVFSRLELFDLYHSPWFLSLMALLALNLVVCSWVRLSGTWRAFRREDTVVNPALFADLPEGRILSIKRDANTAETLMVILSKLRFRKVGRQGSTEGDIYFFGEKSSWSPFVVYLVHFSILIIIAGAVIGSFLGFDGYANIPEGGSVDRIMLKGGKRHPTSRV